MSEISSMSELLMPPLPRATPDGKIERWHVAEGQRIAPGDVLAEIATASATIELEAEREGRIERILVPAGTAGIKVNTPIALLLAEHKPLSAPEPSLLADPPDHAAAPIADTKPIAVQTYREALRDALAEAMRRDETVLVLGSDLAQNRGAQKVTQGLLDEFGERRVVTVPPLEDAVLLLAVGAALRGLRPVVELTSWSRAMEAAGAALAIATETPGLTGGAANVPLVIRGPNGFAPGLTGHSARCVASMLAQMPGLKVIAPATPGTAKALLAAAIRDPGPVAFLEHELLYVSCGPVGGDEETNTCIGRARIARSGDDVTIVTYGRALLTALEATLRLEADGISVEVVDLMTLRPLDIETVLASVQKTGRLLTLEDGYTEIGIGAEVTARVVERAFNTLKAPPARLGAPSTPMPYAEPLQRSALPFAEMVQEKTRLLLKL